MLSKEEWNKASEYAAAAKYGERHASWLRFKRFGAGPLGILAAVGALGLGAWWLFSHLIAPMFSGTGPHFSGHLPFGLFLILLLALLVTIVAFRVRYLSPPVQVARAIIAAFIWLGLAAYAMGLIA